jgi:hypothetical protein
VNQQMSTRRESPTRACPSQHPEHDWWRDLYVRTGDDRYLDAMLRHAAESRLNCPTCRPHGGPL